MFSLGKKGAKRVVVIVHRLTFRLRSLRAHITFDADRALIINQLSSIGICFSSDSIDAFVNNELDRIQSRNEKPLAAKGF